MLTGYCTTGTGTGTDPAYSVVPTSAPYGNSTSSYYAPSGTAPVPTGDPPAGTAASTGLTSSPSSYDPSGTGSLSYTAPTGVPAEYFYHHKKPKRNVSRSSPFQPLKEMNLVLTGLAQAYGLRFGY